MILTVTMNPSIDTRYQVDDFVIDDVNRVIPAKTAGGKGLNVSRVLLQLGDEVLATGMIGGHTGDYMEDLMDEDGIPHSFTRIKGETRSCVNILHQGNQTELLENGPEISTGELRDFFDHYASMLSGVNCVTLSGSLPCGVRSDCYIELICMAKDAGIPVLLDTSGDAMAAALASSVKPTLIKPNLSELNSFFDRAWSSSDIEEIYRAIKTDDRFSGIEWVMISMGSAGSIAIHNGDDVYRVTQPPISAVNATGSGDATIAGFAHAIAAGMESVSILKYGNSCGKLNALDPKTGHIPINRWDEVFDAVSVEMLAF